jgi:hypothetical protein
MKKTIFSATIVADLIQRVQKLTLSHQPSWGRMTVTEMVIHCNITNEGILKSGKSDRISTFKQKFFKFIFFRIKSEFPKLAKAPKRFDTKGQGVAVDLEGEKSKFVQILLQFPELEKPLEAPHPIFGSLSNEEWGIFVYRHMDHHLRQFNV